MAQLNVSMQVPNQNVYNIHHQIDTFKKTFLTPVVECAEAPEPLDDDNIKNIDNITFPGKNFTDFMSECEDPNKLILLMERGESAQELQGSTLTLARWPEASRNQ